MSHRLRRAAAECLLAISACALAHSLLVRPVEQQLAQSADLQRSLTASAGARADRITPAQMVTLDRTSARYRDEIARRSEHARDESLMFAAVMTLASEHNVRVDQVRPTPATKPAAGAPVPVSVAPPSSLLPGVPAAPLAPQTPGDTSTGYTLSVAARYNDLADFIEGLTLRTGFSVVTSVRITADDTDPQYPVSAQIQTEHFAFDLSAVATRSAATEPAPREGGAPR